MPQHEPSLLLTGLQNYGVTEEQILARIREVKGINPFPHWESAVKTTIKHLAIRNKYLERLANVRPCTRMRACKASEHHAVILTGCARRT